ncbi:MAG TPA: trypsin-like peptidase domain-containing protein [Leptospiraceae bacterium]|nr:trypsin-like peptidase domain-containing protein [Leptospiraceae bacterium]HNF13059.1 trypsin-like peptidase domain-containing protein [Leptospiraceae bacterium]HNI96345.1 trypsin-like peptidase domain-containing protein [Leptospiraceae bacterium]HNM05723.1 trypsin-like peptidase domain-containing protein [Leptospiraceae bacterium]
MKREYWKYAGVASVFLLLGTFLTPIIFHTISVQKEIHPLIAQGKRDMSPGKSQAVHMEDAFQEVFDKVSPSVVSIATERTVKFKSPMGNDPFFDHFFGGNGGGRPQEFKQKQTGLGSGIILNEEGYVLTNEHVVRDMEKLTVKLKNKKTYEAKLIGADKVMDIALLKIKPGNDLVPVQIGDSSKVKVGHWAIAIGAPLGFEQSFTVGVVSAIARGVNDASGVGYIQTDAAINQGNSGGPLLNIHGEVIGINRMIISQSGGFVGIGLAIPINDAKRIAEELKTNGRIKRAWLGVSLDNVTDDDAKELKLPNTKGALVKQVVSGSPAESAGIELQDVIVKIGEKDVEHPEDVVSYIMEAKIGKRVELKVQRKNSTLKMLVTPAERPN